MDGFLRQSTASQARLIGPFKDDTDFKTSETGLTIANTDIKLRANGTTLSNKNSGGGTHQVNGMYSVTWDATDTANVGELKYSVEVSGALQVFGSYVVLEEVVYDALFASGAATAMALTSTERTSTADAILARALAAESYAAPGAVPTLSQMMFMMWSFMQEFTFAGTTTKTTKKLDRSTTAMSYTINSITNPQSITRAT